MWRINRCTMSLYIAAAVISVLASLQPLFLLLPLVAGQIPITTKSWELLIGQGNAKWTPRNAHASCAFKRRMWVTGGRSDLHPLYNLESSYKSSDVWYTYDGYDWEQMTIMYGDFFAQNFDALQPGPVAPWYPRFSHTLTSLDINGDGEGDYMILMGGYAPSPINDVWVTEDGITWAFSGYADWSPRAWHAVTTLNGAIFVAGGTPVNNEVWMAKTITYNPHRRAPLTRAIYLEYSYDFKWEFLGEAAWSPRAAMGLVTQFFRPSPDEAGYLRMVLIGGYGGWLDERTDGGLRCRADVWASTDGGNWTLVTARAAFGGLAFFGVTSWEPNITEIGTESERIWLVGGGFIGTTGTREVMSMEGSVDAYWTRDGETWSLINFNQGGGNSGLDLYSSNEWSRTLIDGKFVFLGLWGLQLVDFQPSSNLTGVQYTNGALYIIGGDQTGAGTLLNYVYRSAFGLRCQLAGLSCNGHGICDESTENIGCVCFSGYKGEYCEKIDDSYIAAAPLTRMLSLSVLIAAIVFAATPNLI